MKLLLTQKELQSAFSQSMKKYAHFDWAVAWASVGFRNFDQFKRHHKKARRIIIGTHFYQTHPNFIHEFMGNDRFRFILQPSGIFHPKIYFFENDKTDWACIIGSANFTNAAFSKNSEASIYYDSSEHNALELYRKIQNEFKRIWADAASITDAEFKAYYNLWERSQKYRKRLRGEFGNKQRKSEKSPIQTRLFKYDWPAFVTELRNEKHHTLTMRLKVLEEMSKFFSRARHFQNFSLEERRRIAGLSADGGHGVSWRFFGSMVGCGKFQNVINANDPHISEALDEIPIAGIVLEENFRAYIAKFRKAFPNGRDGLGTASRLLAMKRPDVFICVNDRNAEGLSLDLKISANRIKSDYESYWPEIIERVQETKWWNAPQPDDGEETKIWIGRVALLDAFYYVPRTR